MTTAKYRVILFDLDGTLTDSGKGVVYCVRKALEAMGLPVPPENVLRKFVGPPLFDSFTRLCGLNAEKAEEAILRFRSYYDGVIGNEVYAGIPELLSALRKANALLAVATSKPDSIARIVLEHFGLYRYFNIISAADESDHGSGKEQLIFPVLKKAGCAPGRAVMIGDTRFDAAGAAKSGTDFIGILYGYGTREEMVREGAKVFAPEVGSLYDLLLDKDTPL